jgi:hypothetical protein
MVFINHFFFLSFKRSQILGNRVEMEVADAIVQNNTLLRLNLQFDTLGPRVRVTEKLKQNVDVCKSNLHIPKPKKNIYSIIFSTSKTFIK